MITKIIIHKSVKTEVSGTLCMNILLHAYDVSD